MTSYTINNTEYWVEEFSQGFAWNNDRDEGDVNSPFRPTQLEALQDAIDWEAARRDRYEGSEEQERDAYWAAVNRRMEDKKETAHED